MSRSYKCSTCDEIHEGLPFSYSVGPPDLYNQIPDDEREARVDMTSDQCVIDEKHFFVLGRIELPVIDADEMGCCTAQALSPAFTGEKEIIFGTRVSMIAVDIETGASRDVVPVTGRIPTPLDPAPAPGGAG